MQLEGCDISNTTLNRRCILKDGKKKKTRIKTVRMPDGSVFIIGHIPPGGEYVCVREMPRSDGADLVERIMDGIYGKGRPSCLDISSMGEPIDSHPLAAFSPPCRYTHKEPRKGSSKKGPRRGSDESHEEEF
ncbi:MAG: hypothetical protein U5N86_11225 [Planctomycetota bacterium]|nr:hypothetical protein [Planctomycetota bacterium]